MEWLFLLVCFSRLRRLEKRLAVKLPPPEPEYILGDPVWTGSRWDRPKIYSVSKTPR